VAGINNIETIDAALHPTIQMPRQEAPVRLNGPPASRKPATSPQLERLLNDYDAATMQYGVIVRLWSARTPSQIGAYP
jgi:hypothetical protein